MPPQKKTLRICPQGHRFYKSSDCPICPVCEKIQEPREGFLSQLSAPARRALEGQGILSLETLAGYSEKELLQLHGFGPAALKVLQPLMAAAGLQFC